jgi:hypothetical protein
MQSSGPLGQFLYLTACNIYWQVSSHTVKNIWRVCSDVFRRVSYFACEKIATQSVVNAVKDGT